MRRFVRTSILVAPVLLCLGVASAQADDFLSQEGTMWRASKLVGVNVYGPDQKKVGDINEVLMSQDGKAAYVVVGVGGFLGMGEKNVAIPYDKVTFSQDPVNPPATAAGTVPANTGIAPNSNVGLGTPAVPGVGAAGNPVAGNGMAANTMAPNTMAAAPPRPTAYPDHGTVTYTADQLKAAPTFTYAK